MPRSAEALVEPAILAWARSSAGLSVDEAAHTLQTTPEKVQAWEKQEGGKRPSMAKLRRMATAYHRVLSDFYLPTPPEPEPLPHDFRRLPGDVAFRYSKALRYQLRLARQRRELALDLAAELEAEIPALSGQLHVGADPENAGAELRRRMGVTLQMQRAWRTPRNAYNAWRAAIERVGVLVFQASGIAVSEMLGFSLPDRPLPVIGINRKLHLNGRTFTLLHEAVHVFIGQSSICDIEEGQIRPAEEQRIEVFCNAVAAAALVPREALLSESLVAAHPARPSDWTDDELASLARSFGVSNQVILRRLLTFGRTSQAFYAARHTFWGNLFEPPATDPAETDGDYRRNMPQEVVSDLGRPFARLVIDSYLNAHTSLADVSRHLGLRGQQVSKVQELLGRG